MTSGFSTPALSHTDWCKAFLATLDEDGNETHQTMVFVANNRYPDDNEDDNLDNYFSVRPYESLDEEIQE